MVGVCERERKWESQGHKCEKQKLIHVLYASLWISVSAWVLVYFLMVKVIECIHALYTLKIKYWQLNKVRLGGNCSKGHLYLFVVPLILQILLQFKHSPKCWLDFTTLRVWGQIKAVDWKLEAYEVLGSNTSSTINWNQGTDFKVCFFSKPNINTLTIFWEKRATEKGKCGMNVAQWRQTERAVTDAFIHLMITFVWFTAQPGREEKPTNQNHKQTKKWYKRRGMKVDREQKQRELWGWGEVKYRSFIDKHNRNFRCDVRGPHS